MRIFKATLKTAEASVTQYFVGLPAKEELKRVMAEDVADESPKLYGVIEKLGHMFNTHIPVPGTGGRILVLDRGTAKYEMYGTEVASLILELVAPEATMTIWTRRP